MEDFKDRLHILLDYWIDHNKEHEEEMHEWAARAASVGLKVAAELELAAAKLAEATASLEKAREALRDMPRGA